LGDHILYGPLPNILINGCSNEEAIRTCYDICKWALLHFKNSDTLLSNSFQLVEKQLTERGGRITQTNYRCVVRMPPSQSCQSRTSYLSNWDCLPAAIKPPTTVEERQAICAMMEEMRETLAVDVDPAPIVDRWPTITRVEEGVKKKLLVVGSSHAAKIGDALTKMGHEVEILFEPNWRVFRNNAATLAEKVEEKLATKSFDIILFAVLDNSTYSALAPTGDIIPARRDNAGKYHIDGELVISSKSVLHANLTALKPLLEKAKGRGGVLMSPLPRYVKNGCCSNPDHMPGRESQSFMDRMTSELREIASSLRNFLFTTSMRYIRVLDPSTALRAMSTDQIWRDGDPVHPSDDAYAAIAQHGLRSGEQAAEGAGRKRPRNESDDTSESVTGGGRRPGGGGGRGPAAARRPGFGGGGNNREPRVARGFSFGTGDIRYAPAVDGGGGGGEGDDLPRRSGDRRASEGGGGTRNRQRFPPRNY
jgi:hypothetical protein